MADDAHMVVRRDARTSALLKPTGLFPNHKQGKIDRWRDPTAGSGGEERGTQN